MGYGLFYEDYGLYITRREYSYWYGNRNVTRWEEGKIVHIPVGPVFSLFPSVKVLFGKDKNWGELSFRHLWGIKYTGTDVPGGYLEQISPKAYNSSTLSVFQIRLAYTFLRKPK